VNAKEVTLYTSSATPPPTTGFALTPAVTSLSYLVTLVFFIYVNLSSYLMLTCILSYPSEILYKFEDLISF